jgi:pimeloyl-ACP methyl ester carboxylesterase
MIRLPAGPTSHSYFSQRLRLHYVDWGNPSAPTMLLVHGGRDHCRSWDWVAGELRENYHVIAPDLRGHGDSAWAVGGSYPMADCVYDLNQLVRQKGGGPVTIISHSWGGAISLFFAGVYPELVRRMIVIEGLAFSYSLAKLFYGMSVDERFMKWAGDLRQLSARVPRKYPTLDEAVARMQAENPRLTPEQARHLTHHGSNQNEDGTYSWKFDNYVRLPFPYMVSREEWDRLLSRIACPVLLVGGTESWMTDPTKDDSLTPFADVRSVMIEGAGHWVHHDKLGEFMTLAREFLGQT